MQSPDQLVDEDVEAVLAGSRAVVGLSVRSLADAMESLTLQQYRVLVLICSRGPLRSGALAAAIGVHPSTFTRAVDRLAAAGWVTRQDNPDTRREVLVAPTEKARVLVEQVLARRRTEFEAVLGRMSLDDRASVREGFSRFAAAAGDVDVPEATVLGYGS
ncbi:DNA-binding MarR family transcriptional regulator [Kineococcus radiotolerans]|uniref:Transcriptional regulator, MarR family n=2 Tax=Kineococcus radiotolerans TaxID=131568 RepID=A6WFX5_KINRD|nr:MarR family transcriptional regulator [Kineococcus radiotolerans]ABS05714.1 transcriptional regulator, MarR family [Kineococcus radiotolerans SRS30216 = ATCC BAA-149]MBB2902597.1 DNA-binding MarR family transcriptional regulator [Kineococcus radiotolerans]